jgi:hypothetical protein
MSASLTRPGQQPPIAVIAPPTAANPITGTQVTLDGSGSYDPDGTISEYRWTIVDPEQPGGGITLSGSNLKTLQYTWARAGTFVGRISLVERCQSKLIRGASS